MTKLLPAALLLIFSSCASAQGADPAQAPRAPDAFTCASATQALDEARFISIGGIEQWVTIKGSSCANPVLLYIHGGPGNPASPFADNVYGEWQKDFTLVQWDQRGAGRTFGRNPGTADAELTIEQMAKDGNELAAYVAAHLGQKKVILFGGSWGSALSVHMAKSRPDLFHAYVGTAQLVAYAANQNATYSALMSLVRAADDAKSIAALEEIGPPPWTNPRNFGIVRRITRAYEAKTAASAPKSWWQPSAIYATPEAQAEYEAGEEYSYIQFVGFKGNGMLSRIDLPKLGTNFDIPVFLIQGSEDLVTTPSVSKAYFESIVAPQKKYLLLPATGHDPNPAMVAAQYDVLKNQVMPLIH